MIDWEWGGAEEASLGRDWGVQMEFLKRLFRRQEKLAPPPVPSGGTQTEAQQDATRKHMEAEVAADRKRRGATDIRPGDPPEVDEPGMAPTDDA